MTSWDEFPRLGQVGARILIVDDEVIVQTVIFAALSPLGHELIAANGGNSALVKALRSPPDLVISDVMMPGMDGWSLVRRVRSHPRLAFVPFIFLSALTSVDDVLRGFRLGADDYLPKPFTPEVLIERVNHALQRRRSVESSARDLITEPPKGPAMSGIRGSLSDIGLSSLLVLMELEKKTGTLLLTRLGPPERCKLHVVGGRVFQAHFEAGPPLRNAEAVYYLLAWAQGNFEFHAAHVAVADEIQSSTTGLLMEAARRADENGRAEEALFELGDDEL